MDKKEKTERQRQEDIALNKALFWMVAAAALVALLRLAERYYINFETTDAEINLAWNIGRFLPFLPVVGLLLAAACVYWLLRCSKAGKAAVLPTVLVAFFAGFAVCSFMVWRFGMGGVQLMTYVIIGSAVLALLYYLYQRDFVVVGLACGLGMLGLWAIFREGKTTRLYIGVTLLLLVLAGLAVLARLLQKKHGVLSIKGREIELLPKGANYALIYVTCAIMVLLLAIALIAGGVLSAMAYYAIPVAWLLIMAVYYTVKLM